ncbi:MAG TPA: N-acetyltransferase [Opitutaceae bacterium]
MTAAEEARAINTIVLAFAADPAARWTWPNAQEYLVHMPRLVRAFGSDAFAHHGAHRVEAYAGVALWLPPGAKSDEEALLDIVEGTAPAAVRRDAPGVFEQMAAFHPSEPHWYLPLIGVDPAYQGQGLGDALMRYALERCDAEHLPAYLESSNPRNISLYRRHGFEALGTIQVGSSPRIVPMLRGPR